MKCLVLCSARIENYEFLKSYDPKKRFVICADGGYKHAERLGIVPDLWIGDGDSERTGAACAAERKVFPTHKDFTDTDLAVEEALARGAEEIVIAGGTGGRLDHEFSHFCILKKILDRGSRGVLVDEKNEITMEKDNFTICKNDKKYISFFPYAGNVTGFSVNGLRYSASNMTLDCGAVQASSNCFDDESEAHVSFDSGYVLVIRSND